MLVYEKAIRTISRSQKKLPITIVELSGMNYHRRIQALRAELQKKNLDAFVTSHLPNVRYLTGFSGSNVLVIISHTSTVFLTDFRYKEQIQTEVTADEKIIGQGSLLELAAKRKVFSLFSKIGFEGDHLTVTQFDQLKQLIGEEKLVTTQETIEQLRAVKDDEEIILIKKAVEITDEVFKKILGLIKPGMQESDIAAEISYWHKRSGAEGDAFDAIVASGERGALPHGRASSRKISKNEFVTLDFGCIFQGYHSDMTRTVCIGKPNAEMQKVYSIVWDAQQKALDVITAGETAKSIDAVSRNYIISKGYGEFFGHSLGHSVGLEIHEPFRLSAANSGALSAGHVVTVEPGIYLPNKFGVRIEDMVVVRNQGCEILTGSPKELIVL